MCLLVITYQTCALFGHPVETGSAVGFDEALCPEAKAAGRFGMCRSGATTRNIPNFAIPFCVECNGLDTRAQEKVKTLLQSNEARHADADKETAASSKAVDAPILADDFVRELRGRPVNSARAPAVSHDKMLACLRVLAATPLSKVDLMRAEVWVAAERRRDRRRSPGSALSSRDGLRELFARWLIHACRAAHVEAALAIALGEDDLARASLLQLLAAQTTVTSTYRARLECVGVFEEFLSYAGLDGRLGVDSALTGIESRMLEKDVRANFR